MNLAILSTNKNKYSETFIHNHVKLLPGTIHFLFDGYLPKLVSRDKGLTSFSLIEFNHKKISSFFKKRIVSEKEALESAIEYYLKKHKINAILCEYGPSGVEIMLIAKRCNIPLIVHFHGYDAYRHDILNSYGKQYKELFSIASDIIAVSKHMVEQLKALGCPQNKLHNLCYGINTTIFKPKLSVISNPVFIACGRFVEKKAPQLTIKAFELVLMKVSNAKLIMIGDGELLDECKTLTKQLNISHAVEFKGVLSQLEIAEQFNRAIAFVQHSIITPQNDSEGTPLTILEAMASDLPIVSTLHGGIIDVVINEETGFLVEENNYEQMAEKMLHLTQYPDIANAMGLKASAHINENYTIENYTQKLWDILKHSKK